VAGGGAADRLAVELEQLFVCPVDCEQLPHRCREERSVLGVGIWIHDKNWQQHPEKYSVYPFARFQDDWSSTSPDNEYGAIQSHQIALAGRYGNGVLVAILINGRKSKALNLDYDPKTKGLDFAPPGVELYLGP
jgi:hypothetical protein